jgi:hypothetical protein
MTERNYTLDIPPAHGISCWLDQENKTVTLSQSVNGEGSYIVLGIYEVQELCRHLPTFCAALRGE